MSAAAGGPVAIHQFVPALNPHDATGSHTLRMRDVLRRAGWRSEIFAEAIHDDLAGEAYKYWAYRDHAAQGDVAMYQFTTSSSLAGFLVEQELPLILNFHNFTGPDLFAGWEPQSVVRAARAAQELDLLAPLALLGLADSKFNERTLRRRVVGRRRSSRCWRTTDGSPPSRIRGCSTSWRSWARRAAPTSSSSGEWCRRRPQHDLVKALWAYRRLYDAKARLHLLGGTSSYEYNKSLQEFVDDLGLARAVRMAGEVSDAALAAYFAVAEVFLSLSVHEGFGVPLVEAMSAGIPVVTLDAGAVSETAGDAALVLESTDPSYVAAALHRVSTDDLLRHRLITAGRARAARTPGRRRGHRTGRGDQRGPGSSVSAKRVAFVTPRYGMEVMGGAETAARQLAEHLRASTAWESEVHTTCALNPHTWADELSPGTSTLNGVPVHRHRVVAWS